MKTKKMTKPVKNGNPRSQVQEDINFKPHVVEELPPKKSSAHKAKTLQDYPWWSVVLHANGKWVAVRKGKYANIQANKSILHRKYKDKVEATTRAQDDGSCILFCTFGFLSVSLRRKSNEDKGDHRPAP